MANPSGTHQEGNHGPSSFAGTNSTNGNSIVDGTGAGMKHNPGISMEWNGEEQAVLEEGLVKFASEPNVIRYAKVAMQLQNKTVRDVALRCRWMTKKENSKRRKEEHNSTRKNRDRKERATDTSTNSANFVVQSNIFPYAPPMIPVDIDDGNLYRAVGGVMGELLKRNGQVLEQISANLAALQIHDNFNLFCQTRDNITRIMNNLNEMPEMMTHMPPLPVNIDEELANAILPPTSFRMHS